MPKQFLPILGRPMYVWPLIALSEHEAIDRIVVVTLEDMVSDIEKEIARNLGAGKVWVVPGGATRQQSVFCGLRRLAAEKHPPELVLVHDAARPFLNREILDNTISAVAEHGACTTSVSVADTVKKISDGFVVETLDRQGLVLVQTPQAARFDWLLNAHQSAAATGLSATDDAAVLEEAGYKVAVVDGSPYNLKVTTAEDLLIAEALARVILKASIP